MSRSLMVFRADPEGRNRFEKGHVEFQHINSGKKVAFAALADILSYYGWMNRPDGYGTDDVVYSVQKLLKSRGIGVGGAMQIFMDARIQDNVLGWSSGRPGSELSDVLENSRREMLSENVRGPILAVTVEMGPFRGFTETVFGDPSMHGATAVVNGRRSIVVPLFRLVSWITDQVIGCPLFRNLMGCPLSVGNAIVRKVKDSREYATRIGCIMFALFSVMMDADEDSPGPMVFGFTPRSVQYIIPDRLFVSETYDYNLVFIGDEPMKSELIERFLDIAHADATVSGSAKTMGNSSYRRFKIVDDSAFELYDVHSSRSRNRLMCTMDSVTAKMSFGDYLAVICSNDPGSLLGLVGEFGYGQVMPATVYAFGNTSVDGCVTLPRNDEGLRMLEYARLFGNGSSAANREFTDYCYYSMLESMGLPKTDLDSLGSTDTPEGRGGIVRSMIQVLEDAKDISTGVVTIVLSFVVAACHTDREMETMVQYVKKSGLERLIG